MKTAAEIRELILRDLDQSLQVGKPLSEVSLTKLKDQLTEFLTNLESDPPPSPFDMRYFVDIRVDETDKRKVVGLVVDRNRIKDYFLVYIGSGLGRGNQYAVVRLDEEAKQWVIQEPLFGTKHRVNLFDKDFDVMGPLLGGSKPEKFIVGTFKVDSTFWDAKEGAE